MVLLERPQPRQTAMSSSEIGVADVLGAASHGDAAPWRRCARQSVRRGPVEHVRRVPGVGHGTEMFAVEKELQPQVLACARHAPPRRASERPAVHNGRRSDDRRGVLRQRFIAGRSRARAEVVPEAKSRDKSAILFPEAEPICSDSGSSKLAIQGCRPCLSDECRGDPRSANVSDGLSTATCDG